VEYDTERVLQDSAVYDFVGRRKHTSGSVPENSSKLRVARGGKSGGPPGVLVTW